MDAKAKERRMLVLGRYAGEAVVLDLEDGRRITVMVSRVIGGYVRLAFDAPDTVAIVREELLSRPGGERGPR